MWNGDNTTTVCKYDLKINVVNNLGQRNFFLSQQIPFCKKGIFIPSCCGLILLKNMPSKGSEGTGSS